MHNLIVSECLFLIKKSSSCTHVPAAAKQLTNITNTCSLCQLFLCKYVCEWWCGQLFRHQKCLCLRYHVTVLKLQCFHKKIEKFSLVEPALNLPQKSLHPDVLRAELSRGHFSLEILNWADPEPHGIPTQKHLQCLQFFFLVIVLKRR